MSNKYPVPYHFLIKKMRPNAAYKINQKSYDGIEWLDKRVPKPSVEEFEAAYLHWMRFPLDEFISPDEILAQMIPVKKTFWQKLKGLFA